MSRIHSEAFLYEWIEQADNPDPAQRAWKGRYLEGTLGAYERVGLITAKQATRWRDLFDSTTWPTLTNIRLTLRRHAAVDDYLDDLLAQIRPDSDAIGDEQPRPDSIVKAEAAVDALWNVGALDGQQASQWRSEIARRAASIALRPPGNRQSAVVPPPEPASQPPGPSDALVDQTAAVLPKRRLVLRVLVGTPERHDGLAMTALVVHDDATVLHFHYVGEKLEDAAQDPGEGMQRFRQAAAQLTPPRLTDNAGRAYRPLAQAPSVRGAGGVPDPERRLALTGYWIYSHATPEALSFTAERHDHVWHLSPPRNDASDASE